LNPTAAAFSREFHLGRIPLAGPWGHRQGRERLATRPDRTEDARNRLWQREDGDRLFEVAIETTLVPAGAARAGLKWLAAGVGAGTTARRPRPDGHATTRPITPERPGTRSQARRPCARSAGGARPRQLAAEPVDQEAVAQAAVADRQRGLAQLVHDGAHDAGP